MILCVPLVSSVSASLHLLLLWSSTISAHDSRSANMAFSSRFSFWEQKESLIWTIYTLALHGFAVLLPILPHSSLNKCVHHICLYLMAVTSACFEPKDTQLLKKISLYKKERKMSGMPLQFARCVISTVLVCLKVLIEVSSFCVNIYRLKRRTSQKAKAWVIYIYLERVIKQSKKLFCERKTF